MSTITPPAPSPTLAQSFDDTLGALLIGEIIAAILFGVTSVQIYAYYGRCHHDDGCIMKWAVALLWILDAVHKMLTSHSVYHYTVTNFMNPQALSSCPWSLASNMIVGNFSQVITTGMFAFRIWKLSGKFWLILCLIPPTLCNSAGSMAVTILVLGSPVYEDFTARYSWLLCATFTAWTFCDCIIAVSLCTILARRKTGFRRTDSLIRTLITYIISTGALTSSVAIASAITYAVMPHNFIFIAISTTLPKLHINSVLALLNSRESMRERINEPISIHISKLVDEVEEPAGASRARYSLPRLWRSSFPAAERSSFPTCEGPSFPACERPSFPVCEMSPFPPFEKPLGGVGGEDRSWGESSKQPNVAYGLAY